MFDDVTDRARQVIVLAQGAASLLEHDHVGTEHILLGLIQQSDDEAEGMLKPFGIAREPVEAIVGRGQTPSSGENIPFTPGAEKVLELGARETFQLGHDHVDSEHLASPWTSSATKQRGNRGRADAEPAAPQHHHRPRGHLGVVAACAVRSVSRAQMAR